MFDLWFVKHIPNRQYADVAKETFMKGGYYRADYNDKISLLSFNSLPYSHYAVPELIGGEAAVDQMSWLGSNLAETDGHKFIILDHIYAGARIEHNSHTETFNLWDP